MTQRIVELRSDTFTRPTESMRKAMHQAEVGDDVWGEDPTVRRLEERAAELMGKEAGLFVSSGTQGNLVGVLAHTRLGDEVIVGDQSHIFHYECANMSVVGGLQLRALDNRDGCLDPEDVRRAIRSDDIHEPPTGCVALENTHNRCWGAVVRPGRMRQVADVAHAAGIPVHLDGARIFNAAIALDVPVRELADQVDSLTFCLSKALGAPVGSVVTGSAAFVERARRWRKLLGGGMRQVGVLAAAGLVALEENVERLADDHANARRLAEGLAAIPGIEIDPARVQSNMVYFDIALSDVPAEDFAARLEHRGVRLAGGGTGIRAVTSYEVCRDDIEYALTVIAQVAHELALVPA
jgi:threonine aldolase